MRKINKRGDLAFPIVIFLVLNIAFFTMMLLFVQRVSSNALIYEEAYAKKIGLMLDRAEPGMKFEINITELILVSLKNGIAPDKLNELINIDPEKGIVTVKAKPEGGFSYFFFSKIKIDPETTRPNLKIENGKIIGGTYIISLE